MKNEHAPKAVATGPNKAVRAAGTPAHPSSDHDETRRFSSFPNHFHPSTDTEPQGEASPILDEESFEQPSPATAPTHDSRFEQAECDDQDSKECDRLTASAAAAHERDATTLELEEDAYTLMFLSDFWGPAFALSVVVFILQMSILILTLRNLLRGAKQRPFNLLKIPINNELEVIVAQFISLIALVLLRGDSFVILTQLIFPPSLDTICTEGNSKSTRLKWMLVNACRFTVCLLSVAVSFIIIVQTDQVIDIFKDFAAILFVTDLAKVAFFCAKQGFFGVKIKECSLSVSSSKLVTARNWWTTRARMGAGIGLLSLVTMLAGLGYLVKRQETNMLLMEAACMRVEVRFGSHIYDFSKIASPFPSDLANLTKTPLQLNPSSPSAMHYVYFNGIYHSDWDNIHNERPTYLDKLDPEHSATAGNISYCSEESVWIFTIGAFDDGVERGRCGQWLARSEETTEFLLENVPPGWTVWTGSAQPMDHMGRADLDVTCLDCRKSSGESGCNFNGACQDKDGTCKCRNYTNTEEAWFGERCEASPPCTPVDAFVHGESSSDYRQVAHFMPLFIAPKEGNERKERVLAYQRPVYWNKKNPAIPKQNFLLYTGNRWFMTDWPLVDMCPGYPNVASPCNKEKFADFFSNDFHAYWFDTLIRSTTYVSEETESYTPAGLAWLTLGSSNSRGDFGPLGYTYDEGLSVHCFKNDCTETDLCGDNGECGNDSRYNLTIRSSCKCKDGSSGYFCQFGPQDPYVDDGCNEYFCDYIEDQELGQSGKCSNVCSFWKKEKACWNTPPPCTDDPSNLTYASG